jgi:hypothetical protein
MAPIDASALLRDAPSSRRWGACCLTKGTEKRPKPRPLFGNGGGEADTQTPRSCILNSDDECREQTKLPLLRGQKKIQLRQSNFWSCPVYLPGDVGLTLDGIVSVSAWKAKTMAGKRSAAAPRSHLRSRPTASKIDDVMSRFARRYNMLRRSRHFRLLGIADGLPSRSRLMSVSFFCAANSCLTENAMSRISRGTTHYGSCSDRLQSHVSRTPIMRLGQERGAFHGSGLSRRFKIVQAKRQ